MPMFTPIRYMCVSALLVIVAAASANGQPSESSKNRCTATAPLTVSAGQLQWNGWGASPTQQRFQPAERARLGADAVPKLTLKWAFGFPGAQAAYGQPSVAGNRLFVGSSDGTVYALGADTGCLHWTFKAGTQVRTAISIGMAGNTVAIYFGDQKAVAYALDATTGALLWKTQVDEHPAARITGAPTLANGRLYVPTSSSEEGLAANPMYPCCTFRGSLSALDATTGAVIWKSFTIAATPKPVRKNRADVQLSGPSGAAIWSSPTVDLDGGMVFVTTGDSYSDPVADTSDAFIAFDLKTGKLLWSRQMTSGDAFTVDCDFPDAIKANCPVANGPDFDFGSSAVLVNLGNGKRALIAGQKSGVVHAIDPDRGGEILWQRKIGQGGRIGGIQWGMSADANYIYAALSDVAIVAPLPGGTGGRPTMFGIPLMLSPDAGGGLYALDLKTGEIAWKTPHPGCNKTPGCSPAQSAATTAIPGVVFSGGLDGHLRAYDAKSGRIIWDVDTEHKFATVNGVEANGGSLDGSGAVVVNGILYVNSGYIFTGHTPGNVLLAFAAGN
jgi:polyvinyl alcohol dehydrogenase (cytochrome)